MYVRVWRGQWGMLGSMGVIPTSGLPCEELTSCVFTLETESILLTTNL